MENPDIEVFPLIAVGCGNARDKKEENQGREGERASEGR